MPDLTLKRSNALLVGGVNTFEVTVMDVGDLALDSGVVLQAGTFSASATPVDVAEPASMALMAVGLTALARLRRKAGQE